MHGIRCSAARTSTPSLHFKFTKAKKESLSAGRPQPQPPKSSDLLFDRHEVGAKAEGRHKHGQVPNGGVADRHD